MYQLASAHCVSKPDDHKKKMSLYSAAEDRLQFNFGTGFSSSNCVRWREIAVGCGHPVYGACSLATYATIFNIVVQLSLECDGVISGSA